MLERKGRREVVCCLHELGCEERARGENTNKKKVKGLLMLSTSKQLAFNFATLHKSSSVRAKVLVMMPKMRDEICFSPFFGKAQKNRCLLALRPS